MKLVCNACQLQLRPKKNDVLAMAVTIANGSPHTVHSADLWECPSCGYEIIAGFASSPLAMGKACSKEIENSPYYLYWTNPKDKPD